MFKSKSSTDSPSSKKTKHSSSSATNSPLANGKVPQPQNQNPSQISHQPLDLQIDHETQNLPVEVGKEAKEKGKRASWVKTIGGTLRMKRSTESRSSRLSLPSFGSLDRHERKKGKDKDKKDKSDPLEPKDLVSPAVPLSTSTVPTVEEEKVGETGENSDKHDPSRFLGDGLTFRGKLIGVLEVSGPRGDRICQEALSDLKMAVKAAGEHKQKVTVHVALDGLRIRDEKTGDCLYHHQVHKISFIAQDLTDTRAFGYIFGSPDTGHRFFGIKTEKSASQVVIAMRDLFQVVFDLKKKEIEKAKQQLEMQQKFLATRAAETTTTSTMTTKTEPKFSIAETYIEGACAAGTMGPVPNRVAPEVDLLNLEEELTSLQVGLDSIHHNLTESRIAPFRGSTASISSDAVPTPKRASVSSHASHASASSATPLPSGYGGGSGGGGSGDPFGDSFVDPFADKSGPVPNFHLGPSSSSKDALNSPFPADPFAQVDPFPRPKFPGDSDFFNSDPFESPSGPFSFSFPSMPGSVVEAVNSSVNANASEGRKRSSVTSSDASDGRKRSSVNPSPVPLSSMERSMEGSFHQHTAMSSSINKEKDGWTASFEDNFVPETEKGPTSITSLSKKDIDVFLELDPLRSAKPRVSNDSLQFRLGPSSISSRSSAEKEIPNSFSTNFNPPSFHSHRSDSPPKYSPPAPPRLGNPDVLNTQIPYLQPPATGSPRLGKKKSPQILKQMTIADSVTTGSSPKTLPKLGKQSTLDSSRRSTEEIPSLSPPPRPPHTHGHAIPGGPATLNRLSSAAVPRPTSASTLEKGKVKQVPGAISLPPEPPPRPGIQEPSLVSPPPPLPPKKTALANTMSAPLQVSLGKRVLSNSFSVRPPPEANDLPLPLPVRKNHSNSFVEQSSSSALQQSRYAEPVSPDPQKLAMEKALEQVASMSLRDLSVKLEMPVEKLSAYTIQQLAQKLTEMDIGGGRKRYGRVPVPEREEEPKSECSAATYGFEDDFSTASAPPKMASQSMSSSGVDRYAVFREIDLEDASGFSIINNVGSEKQEDDNESTTTLEVEKPLASRESSSERTLQADDITEPINARSASFAVAANTMDDVTDVNLSDDGDGRFAMDDEEEGDFLKNEWATFEPNFDDQFATTALVKADGNESPWDSDNDNEVEQEPDRVENQFDFKPFQKPADVVPPPPPERKQSNGDIPPPVPSRYKNLNLVPTSPEKEKVPSPTHKFQRQSSGSSKHSEKSKSSGGGGGRDRDRDRDRDRERDRASDYSDSGRAGGRRHPRSKDYDRWEREEPTSARYRDRDYPRPDSRSSYNSTPRRHYRNANGESEEEYSTARRGKARPVVRRGSKDYDYERERDFEGKEIDSREEEDDRSYQSYPSSGGGRSHRHRRYPSGKHYYSHYHGPYHSGRRRRESPDRYSNHESDDESVEEENYYRKRGDYAREYYDRERHHRPRPSSATGRKHSRESPRHSDSYYRRGRRYSNSRDEDESREISEYSGEEDHPSHYSGHRRMRAKRTYNHKDYKDGPPPPPRGHYYTNSPSWDSESGPEERDKEKERGGDKAGKRQSSGSRPNSGKNEDRGESPEFRRKEGRKYQSELALNSKKEEPVINFEESFEHVEASRGTEKEREEKDLLGDEIIVGVAEESQTQGKKTASPFEDDFVIKAETEIKTNGGTTEGIESPTLEEKGVELEQIQGAGQEGNENGNGIESFQPTHELPNKTFSIPSAGRRLESIKSEEEKSNDDSHSGQNGGSGPQMKKSDSFNIFKPRADDPFADDEFFA